MAEAQALVNRVVLPPAGVVDVTVDEDDDPLIGAGSLAGTGEGWRRGRDSVALTIRVERELAQAFKRGLHGKRQKRVAGAA